MLLEHKNAVIYGGAGAIGGTVAQAMAAAGARVFLAGRTAARLLRRLPGIHAELARERLARLGRVVAEARVLERRIEGLVVDHPLRALPGVTSASVTDRRVVSMMFLPAIVTESDSGFSRNPLQVGHGLFVMYRSSSARIASEPVSR